MDKKTHILILGTPRGGTSLLFNMIVAGYPQLRHADGEAPATEDMKADVPRVSKRPADSSRFHEIMEAARAMGKTLKPIVVIRDPRDVVVSQNVDSTRYDIHPDGYFDKRGSWQPILGYWPLYLGMQEWMGAEGIRVLSVHYEDLVQDTETVQAFIEDFIGFQSDILFRNFHEVPHAPMTAGHRAKPLLSRWIGRWREPRHRERIVEVFGGCPGILQAVTDLGYEKDDDWLVRLKSETPHG